MNSFHDIYHQIEDYFFSLISHQCLAFEDEAKAYMSGVPVADLNILFVKKICDLSASIAKSKLFYEPTKLPFVITIPENLLTPKVQEILKHANCLPIYQSKAMILNLENINQSDEMILEEELAIALNQNLKDWAVPVEKAFESNDEMISIYAQSHLKALDKGGHLEHYCLYKRNQPVSAMTLSILNHSARIDDLGTLPEFQRQGYASLLLNYGVLRAKALGATVCCLEASVSGFKMYQNLGFKILYNNASYTYPQF